MTVVIVLLLDVLSGARERSEAVRAARVPRELGALHPSKCLFPDVVCLAFAGRANSDHPVNLEGLGTCLL